MSKTESSGNGLLMPLAIGGGLLLLFLSMNKAKANTNASATDIMPLEEEIPKEGNMIPEKAPSYTELDEETDISAEESSAAPNANRNQQEPIEQEENFDDEPIPANNPAQRKIIVAPSKATGLRQQSDQNRMFAERGAIPSQQSKINKLTSMRQQSDQNRKFAERGANTSQQNKMTKLTSMRQNSDQNRKFSERGGMSVQNNPLATKPLPQSAESPKVFPLKFGQTNSYIKAVQQKLGVSNTGFFGALTKAALLKKYKVSEVSEALYQQIIAAKAVAPKKLIAPKKAKKAPVKKKITKVVPKKKAKKK